VFYEAPHRMERLSAELPMVFGADRPVAISRELTKRFETTWRGLAGAATANLGEPRGEYVVVVGGASSSAFDPPDDRRLLVEFSAEIAAGSSRKDAAATIGARYGLSKKYVYDLGLGARSGNGPAERKNITEP
jgi:16S rRNA (cytidine1402-2'-O)-methyltransferase